MIKIYLGEHDDNNNILKLGYTEQTCYARCKNSDYTIFSAVEVDVTSAEMLFIESYVRLAFNAMTETTRQIRQDYFIIRNDINYSRSIKIFKHEALIDERRAWGAEWLYQFVKEAVDIINQKRTYSRTLPTEINKLHFGMVRPYTY